MCLFPASQSPSSTAVLSFARLMWELDEKSPWALCPSFREVAPCQLLPSGTMPAVPPAVPPGMREAPRCLPISLAEWSFLRN